ncbi:MAG: BamA/TamA family outer membrane protein [Candidatus Sericytochromatia bacterium]|nr:BamA/TamA family outer membrane protein [Candidatus Sericytochromatia bacterium]
MSPCLLPGRLAAAAVLPALILAPRAGLAANHPERRWHVQESRHFRVHCYPEVAGTAQRVLEAAEEAYPRLLRVFGAQPGPPIPIILDQDALFNGEAEPLKDRITLDPALATSSVVGTRRFVAHELAHVMTFRALQGEHVLTRLNHLGGLPTWLLEGVAQLAAEPWTPSLDRMLRLSCLENQLLTPGERAHFRQLGVHAGAAGYNEGFALCRALFGDPDQGRLATLFRHLRTGQRTFAQAVQLTCGAPLEVLEARWRTQLRAHYASQTRGLDAQPPGARRLAASAGGEVHLRPRLSPDGHRLAFLTSRRQDSFLYLRGRVQGLLTLAVAAADGSNVQLMPAGQGGVTLFDWSPDSQELAYTRLGRDADGNPTFDLHALALATGASTRLTTGAYVVGLAWRPGTSQLALVTQRDGVNQLVLLDRTSRALRHVRTLPAGWQWRDLAFSPDGRRLVAVAFQPGNGGQLICLDWEQGRQSALTPPPTHGGDSAPWWTPDGRRVVFTSDRDGMANLHELDVATGRQRRLTRTWRGAETPNVSGDGRRLLFTTYRARGAELLELPLVAPPAEAHTAPLQLARPLGLRPDWPEADRLAAGPPVAMALSGQRVLPTGPGGGRAGAPGPTAGSPAPGWAQARPYRSELTQDLLLPQFTADERGQQVGVAATFSDVLRQQELGLDVRWGVLSQRFAYSAAYVNRMARATWQGRVFDAPQLGLSPDVGVEGRTLIESLYLQRLRGASVGLQLPLGGGRSLVGQAQAAHLGTLTPPVSAPRNALREGALNTLSGVLSERQVRPTLDQDLNPSDGYRLALGWTWSGPALGSDFAFHQWLLQGERYFPIVPAWRHNLTWRWSMGLMDGAPPQPFLLGGPNSSSLIFPLRGHAVGALSGHRLASTGLEYTLPLATHLDRTLGPLYLDRLYLSTFVEMGTAWGGSTPPAPLASAGLELRLRATIGGRQLISPRLGVAHRLGGTGAPGVYLTF